MFQANEHRIEFKKLFLEKIAGAEFNSTILDQELAKFVKDAGLKLSPFETQQCIRELEKTIGDNHKRRLKRLRGIGYQILDPIAQVNLASTEGKHKIRKALKKTVQRYDAADRDKLPANVKTEVDRRKMAMQSLLLITEKSAFKTKIESSDIKLLDTTVNDLRALELLK